ncbi:hypothetical protein ACWEP4_42980 [Streptomyces sp. NPDC004227]
MRRHPILWSLLVAWLIVIGLWSAAATPIVLAAAGAAVVLGTIPGPVLVLAAVAVWLYFRHHPARPATA